MATGIGFDTSPYIYKEVSIDELEELTSELCKKCIIYSIVVDRKGLFGRKTVYRVVLGYKSLCAKARDAVTEFGFVVDD